MRTDTSFFKSLRFKISAFIGSLLLILLLLLNVYPIISSRDLIFEEKKSALTGQASVVATSLSGLDRTDKAAVAEVLRFLDLSGFQRIMVVSDTGIVIYDDGGKTGVYTDKEDILLALEGKTVFRSNFEDGAFSSSIAMPMSREGLITGSVYLLEHDPERAEILLSIQSRIGSISLVIGLAVLVVAIIFGLRLMRRLRDLTDSMQVVANGNYAYRHNATGQDEISHLGVEFNHLTERLESTEKQRRRFVSDASHELKTPLASIRLLSDSIVQSENMDSETMREFVTDIGSEAERLQRTTEKLLDLSRLDDQVQIVPEPVDVKQVAVDAMVLLRPLADEKGVRIRADLADGCVVMATVDDMFHIIYNLVENAIKYNVPEGSVFLRLSDDGETVHFAVEDTGIGIPEEDRFNIFARFYRVDKARSREAGGSGLGLSIVHDAVQAHGGSIAVGQNKPQGSKFIVSFPKATPEETGI